MDHDPRSRVLQVSLLSSLIRNSVYGKAEWGRMGSWIQRASSQDIRCTMRFWVAHNEWCPVVVQVESLEELIRCSAIVKDCYQYLVFVRCCNLCSSDQLSLLFQGLRIDEALIWKYWAEAHDSLKNLFVSRELDQCVPGSNVVRKTYYAGGPGELPHRWGGAMNHVQSSRGCLTAFSSSVKVLYTRPSWASTNSGPAAASDAPSNQACHFTH